MNDTPDERAAFQEVDQLIDVFLGAAERLREAGVNEGVIVEVLLETTLAAMLGIKTPEEAARWLRACADQIERDKGCAGNA